jgi:outer membrane protein assembly factor BamB
MRKITYLSWLALILYSCGTVPNIISSYSEPLDVQVNTKIIDIKKTDEISTQIKALEFKFPFEVKNIAVDTMEMKALVFIRKSGENPTKTPGILTYYNLQTQKVIWTKHSFCWDPKFFIKDKIIIQGKGKVFAISKNNGELLWERVGSYFLYNKDHKLGFTGSVTAFSLETGKDLWHRDLVNKFGWDESKFIGSKLIIAADGLHAFDLKDGQGWDNKMMSGKTNEGGAIAASIGLSVLSALVGGGVVTVDAKVWSDMTSNILYGNNHIFFSAKSQFVCIEIETGMEVWRVTLPEKETAHTFIHFDGDHIILTNTGSCLNEGKEIKYGKPYIAKYEKFTGEQTFFSLLDVKSPIKDVFISENGYYLISNETFSHYDLEGNEKARLRYDGETASEKYGNFLFFSDDNDFLANNYINVNGEYKTLSGYYKNKLIPMAVTVKGVMIFNEDYSIENWFTIKQVYHPKIEAKSNKLCRNYSYLWEKNLDESSHQIFLIDELGNNNGSLQIKNPISKAKDFIYYRENNRLTLISKSVL